MAKSIDTQRKGELMQAVFRELLAASEPLSARELIRRVGPKLNLNAYESEILEKSGYVRWHTVIHWFSVDCSKAGFLLKANGRWTLTEAGKEALKLDPAEFVRRAHRAYALSRTESADDLARAEAENDGEDIEGADEKVARQVTYEQALEVARDGVEKHIFSLSPFDFQRLVAELLIGMGYHVPLVAPPGPDGGIDIVAYKDPLGTSTPRIRCQVKHRQNNGVTAPEVRALVGTLRTDGDMGLIVSSGGFTSPAITEIRAAQRHIETMDLDRLIDLWQQYYANIREQGKILLPIVPVYFLAPAES